MASYDTSQNILTGISQGSFDKIYLRDASGNMVDLLTLLGSLGSVTDVISNSSELVVTTNGTTKILALNLGGYVTSTALTNALAAYTDTTALTAFLGAKQNTLTAGTGIAISGATISSTHTPIILQLDGTTQSGATTLNFVGNNASFASNVLNISRMAWQDALTLRYSNSASDKNLSQGSAGELLWNGLEVQLRQNAFHQINVVAPLTASGSNILTIDSLWKPSTVTVGTGIQAVASDANGTLQLSLTGTESRSQLKLIDSQNVVRSIVPSITGALTYNSSTLVDLTYLSSNFSTTASVNTSLAAKQPTLTTGAGTFLNGATISSYTLRWNGSSTPSVATAIQELHWDSYTMAETVNIGTGKIELTIGHPTDMATQTWTNTQLALKANDADVTLAFAGYNGLLSQKAETSQVLTNVPANAVFTDTLYTHPSQHSISMITGLQTELNKISGLKTGVSGLSLGGGTGAAHRFAVHEVEIGDPYHTAGSYMYGMGLYVGSTVGTAFWGGTLAALPDQGSGTGAAPHLFIQNNGLVGVNTTAPGYTLDITGDIRATGVVYGSVKSFDIAHPDPSKPDMRLRHWVTESNEPGGNLLYRFQVDAVQGNNTIQMPDYFKHLATNVMCVASPVRHFGLCWADLDNNDSNCIILGTSRAGIYNVILTAKRNDICATTMCPQEVEYQPAEELPGEEPFPTPK